MPISTKFRAIFVHIPKNAGTAVLHALEMGKNEGHVPWFEYEKAIDAEGRAQIRVKALTLRAPGVPPVQYVEYAPGHTDPMHSHDTDEFFIVTEGERLQNVVCELHLHHVHIQLDVRSKSAGVLCDTHVTVVSRE